MDTSAIPITSMSDREKRERDWLFWVIFCQDKCLALHLGRDMRIVRPKNPLPLVLSTTTGGIDAVLFPHLRNLYLVGTTVLETMCVNLAYSHPELIY